jgi:predicted nicotinamide N-methyase
MANSLKLQVPPKLASVIFLSTLSISPFGNIGEAWNAVTKDLESLTCTLNTQQANEFHGSCQLAPNIVRVRAGKVFTIRQDWGGSASTGAAVWQGANMATWFLENELGRAKLQGSNVLELGAGVGFDGLVANALGAKEVMITDGNEDVLKLADENIRINVDHDSLSKGSIKTSQLRWNTEDEQNFLSTPWDYIFAADVTYLKKNRKDLFATISKLSNEKTITYVSMEPRNVDEVEDVLRTAQEYGLKWKEEKLPVDSKKDECSLLCARMFSFTK